MEKLGTEADRLCQLYPEKATEISTKTEEAKNRWEALKQSAEERKRALDRSYNRHRFMADYRELCDWINGIRVLIESAELAKDVAGAEALLEQHQVWKKGKFK
jgi:ABC-type Zn uptake system ZnuABC Zn-binding protein ZnuA